VVVGKSVPGHLAGIHDVRQAGNTEDVDRRCGYRGRPAFTRKTVEGSHVLPSGDGRRRRASWAPSGRLIDEKNPDEATRLTIRREIEDAFAAHFPERRPDVDC
jgi:hypothetical protein